MPIKIKLYNQKVESIGEEILSDKAFNVGLNEDLLHQAFVRQISNERQVLAHTKGRSEVRGGGKKPWNQKGTGRARAGSSRSPIWIGGGVTFGPTSERNYKKNINKKMRQKAIYMALSDKVKNEKFILLDKFELKDFKTKEVEKIVTKFEKTLKDKKTQKRSILIVVAEVDEKIKYSCRNIKGIELINTNNINLKNLLRYRSLVLTLDAKKIFETRVEERKVEKKVKKVEKKKEGK